MNNEYPIVAYCGNKRYIRFTKDLKIEQSDDKERWELHGQIQFVAETGGLSKETLEAIEETEKNKSLKTYKSPKGLFG